MASNSHYFSNNTFSSSEAPTIGSEHHSSCLAMCYRETFPFFDDGALNMVDSHTMPASISPAPSNFSKQLIGVPDFTTLSIQDFGGSCEYAWSTHASAAKYHPEMNEFGEECNGSLLSNYWPVHSMAAADNWEIQAKTGQRVGESTPRVGRYTVEERKEKILKYLRKRNQRNFNKTIKYACRKTLADRRVRVRGRFAKNSETYEDETLMKANDSPSCEAKEFYYDGSLQINCDDEDWLQEAISSLMYVPYVDY